ncbi:MAG: hypothetical protein HYS26_00600 [Candidatus Kaiserbacteria bacterium]|nr:MAG: hypothetical protein HYS26_00600 [Candidatus Kaiserbacteria bacterium]
MGLDGGLRDFLRDKNRRNVREKAAGVDLAQFEHGEAEKKEEKLPERIADPKKAALLSATLDTLDPSEKPNVDALKEVAADETKEVTLEHLKTADKTRLTAEHRGAWGQHALEAIKDEEFEDLALHDEGFGAIWATFKNNEEGAKFMREFLTLRAAQKDDLILEVTKAQEKVRMVESSRGFAKAKAATEQLVKDFGYKPEHFSIIERLNWTPAERRAELQQVRSEIFARWYPYLAPPPQNAHRIPEKGFDQLARAVAHTFALIGGVFHEHPEIADEERKAADFVREHIRSQSALQGPLGRLFINYKANRAVHGTRRLVKKIEESGAVQALENEQKRLGGLMATSLSKEKDLMRAFLTQAMTGESAEAIPTRGPKTFAEFEKEKNSLDISSIARKDWPKYRDKEAVRKFGNSFADLADADKNTVRDDFMNTLSSRGGGGAEKPQGLFGTLLGAVFRAFWSVVDKNALRTKLT